jgi:deoxyuridine 5'-triphosphate nucleotidohydrolase
MNEQASSPLWHVPVKVTRLSPEFDDIPLPHYATEQAAGMDIRAAVAEPITLQPGDITAVPTNLAIELPPGYEMQVRPRSGLALKHGITLPNAPGTIDADYRGEIKIITANTGREPFTIERGERIAQLVLAPVVQAAWVEVDALNDTARSGGGFGSTGKS